jgi:hypothetical protein
MFEEPRRARRIRLTRQISERRRSEFINQLMGGDTNNPVAKKSPHYWAKNTITCTCRKRVHGQPRRGIGMCDLWARNRIYRCRAQAKYLTYLVTRGADLEGDRVALAEQGFVNDLW